MKYAQQVSSAENQCTYIPTLTMSCFNTAKSRLGQECMLNVPEE